MNPRPSVKLIGGTDRDVSSLSTALGGAEIIN